MSYNLGTYNQFSFIMRMLSFLAFGLVFIGGMESYTEISRNKTRSKNYKWCNFYLYKRSLTKPISLNENNLSHLDRNLWTKLILHGWMDDYKTEWVQRTKEVYLKKNIYNVILVDYKEVAHINYISAWLKAPKVANDIANFLFVAHKVAKLNLNKLHMIGYSLGGQIAGMAGYILRTLAKEPVFRVSGLDPAGPIYNLIGSISRKISLHSAKYVDVYHTDIIKFGTCRRSGTVDYYLNRGFSQPHCLIRKSHIKGPFQIDYLGIEQIRQTCENNSTRSITGIVLCSHRAAYMYWIQSINDYKTYPSNQGDVKVGENADFKITGKLYLEYKLQH